MKLDINDFRLKLAYEEAAKLEHHQEQMILQRFNYFLIATSFLIAAFATLAVNSDKSSIPCLVRSLAFLVSITGLLLSWLFAIINNTCSKILDSYYDYAKGLEDKLTSDKSATPIDIQFLPYQNRISVGEINRISRNSFIKIFKEGGCLVHDLLRKSSRHKPMLYHPWMIPLCFVPFWLIVIIIYSVCIFL